MRDTSLPTAYSDSLEQRSLGPLWTQLHMLLPRERQTRVVPYRWKWTESWPLLLEAARLVPIEQAERRVLVLMNPGLGGAYSITSTLYGGLQIILPGEQAPSHHHTPTALRLIVHGHGAYTTVDGVKCAMEPGDLILTPAMHWHDHGHEGTEPVVWLDGLDIPLVRAFEASWVSATLPAKTPETDIDSSQDELTAAGLVPRRSRYVDESYPQVRWPWTTVREALVRMARTTAKDDPVVMRYVNPRTGTFPMPTIGCQAHWLRPDETSPLDRCTAGRVYQVIEGRGESRVGNTVLTWEAGDTFVAPPWQCVSHRNTSSSEAAALFTFDDEPALRSLGLWQEEREGQLAHHA